MCIVGALGGRRCGRCAGFYAGAHCLRTGPWGRDDGVPCRPLVDLEPGAEGSVSAQGLLRWEGGPPGPRGSRLVVWSGWQPARTGVWSLLTDGDDCV